MSILFLGNSSEGVARKHASEIGALEFEVTPDTVRELEKERGKVIAIFNVDSYSRAIQNALLKNIEEGNKFVLSSNGYILPTIRSRCTVVQLPYAPSGETFVFSKMLNSEFSDARACFMETMLAAGLFNDAFNAIFAHDHTDLQHETINIGRRRTFFDKKRHK